MAMNLSGIRIKALYFSLSVQFTTFPRQTLIVRCVIIVDVFSHPEKMLHIQRIHVSPNVTTYDLPAKFSLHYYEMRSSSMRMMAPQFAPASSFVDNGHNAAGVNVHRSARVV